MLEDEGRLQLEALGDRLDPRRPEGALGVDEERHALGAAVRLRQEAANAQRQSAARDEAAGGGGSDA